MSTHTQICYHVVFSTKDRQPILRAECREDLFRYIWGILKNRESHLYRINGTEDHVHILSEPGHSPALSGPVRFFPFPSVGCIPQARDYSRFAPSGQSRRRT
jgi:REP element-mobilizing transposase RayT